MVGTLIRERRRARGWSQETLADKMGWAQTYLSRVERGEVDVPQRATLEKLGGILGISLPEFYQAAGMLDDLAVTTADPPPASPLPPSDDGPFDPAAIVAYVKSRPGRRFQEQVAEEERRLPPEEFVDWCLDVFAAWASNSNLALRSLRRGERARDRGQDERT